MNPVSRRDLALGKWMAVCVFSLACVVLTLLCALVVLYATPLGARVHAGVLIWMLAVAAPLVPLAAGLSLLVCTFARSSKEGNSYLTVLLLAPMLTGVLAKFFPVRLEAAIALIPVLSQQRMLSALSNGQMPPALWLAASAVFPLLLGAAAVAAVARLLRRERIIFGR